MHKIFLLSALLLSFDLLFCQQLGYYKVIIEEDTFSIDLTKTELNQASIERYVQLEYVSRFYHKKKKLQENIGGHLKLKDNDTTFWVSIYDYYDHFFIGFVGTSKKISKKEYDVTPLGFRRIEFDQIEWIETDGKQNIWPQFILGFQYSFLVQN